MNESGESYRKVMKELLSASKEDFHFAGGYILGSMCTEPLEIAKEVHALFIEANLGNPRLYLGTQKLERAVIQMLAELLHGRNLCGQIVGGGSEANITALWIARNLTKGEELIFPRSAHFSFIKACDLLKLRPIPVDLDEEFKMCVDDVEEKLSNRTVAVVAIAGTTELGVIDPIAKLSQICYDNFFLHVDAAFGGFVIPFLKDLGYNIPKFDFELDGVKSMTVDPHKMGMATIPSGVLLTRDASYFESIAVESPYLTEKMQVSLAGTRCSAAVASTYAVMKFLGRKGYRKIVAHCMSTTEYLLSEIRKLGLDIVIKPTMNIVGIKVKNLAKIYSELDKMGWKLSQARYPKCLRIVIMPHVTKKVVDNFIIDLESVCKKVGEI